MDKKYKIILLQDGIQRKTYFQTNVRKTVYERFRSLEEIEQPNFTTKYVKRKVCQFELGMFSLTVPNYNIYTKDSLGRNTLRNMSIGDYHLIKIIPYWVEERVYDHNTKKRVMFNDVLEKYLGDRKLKQIFSLNNKTVIQKDEEFFLFSHKNVDDSNRFLESIRNFMVKNKRYDCLIVPDYDTIQRKQLYDILESKGFNREFLYKHYTY
jgi:hypothetical protein